MKPLLRKKGDVSRRRRLESTKAQWYSFYRAVRFARRFGGRTVKDTFNGFVVVAVAQK